MTGAGDPAAGRSSPPSGPLHTPSLRRRVVLAGFGVGAAVVVALSAFVFLNLRAELRETADQVLAARVTLVAELASTLESTALDERLHDLGVPAIVVGPDGERVTDQPALDQSGQAPPAQPDGVPARALQADVEVSDGGVATVLVSQEGIDRTLDRLLVLETLGTVLVLLALLVVLLQVSTVVLTPLRHVVATARRIAAGRTGERLMPDRPTTELGQMAMAFDEMLDALEEALEEMRDAEQDARTSEARMRRFLADAAHQLRTPIAALRASVDTLLRIDDPHQRDDLLVNVGREAARTSRLVDHLLRLAALDSDEAPLRRTPTDIAALVLAEVERAEGLAPDLAVRLDRPDGPVTAPVDATAVREALANLLDNARRHARTTVRVTVEEVDGMVRVDVVDDGPGVAEADRDLVFERFHTGAGNGSGLGLPISRSTARGHGGDVALVDGRFQLTLPTSAPPSGDPQV